jgi:acyl-CoA reductase-like NAD-dependent aldehyde dehydrogenase
MTSLEKTAIAAAEVVRQQKDSSLHFDGMAIARAVLLAVRDDALSIAEEAFGPAGGGREADDFRQAIDAILQEKGDG